MHPIVAEIQQARRDQAEAAGILLGCLLIEFLLPTPKPPPIWRRAERRAWRAEHRPFRLLGDLWTSDKRA